MWAGEGDALDLTADEMGMDTRVSDMGAVVGEGCRRGAACRTAGPPACTGTAASWGGSMEGRPWAPAGESSSCAPSTVCRSLARGRPPHWTGEPVRRTARSWASRRSPAASDRPMTPADPPVWATPSCCWLDSSGGGGPPVGTSSDRSNRARGRTAVGSKVQMAEGTSARNKGRKEGNVLFNNALNTYYFLRLYGIGLQETNACIIYILIYLRISEYALHIFKS